MGVPLSTDVSYIMHSALIQMILIEIEYVKVLLLFHFFFNKCHMWNDDNFNFSQWIGWNKIKNVNMIDLYSLNRFTARWCIYLFRRQTIPNIHYPFGKEVLCHISVCQRRTCIFLVPRVILVSLYIVCKIM